MGGGRVTGGSSVIGTWCGISSGRGAGCSSGTGDSRGAGGGSGTGGGGGQGGGRSQGGGGGQGGRSDLEKHLEIGQTVKVKHHELYIDKKLGSGHFGTVYKVQDITSKRIYALKQVLASKRNLVKREIEMLAKADHKHIVRILGFDSYEGSSLILSQYCSGGDLNSRLNKSSSDETNLKWIQQLSKGVAYLHSRNPPIVHRDLKADNVLLKDKSSEELMLTDFGLAREYQATKSDDPSFASAKKYYMTSEVGPIHFMAPEFLHKHYTQKADIFALGGIFFAILTRDFLRIDGEKMYGVCVPNRSGGKAGLGFAMAYVDKGTEVQFPQHFRGSNSMKQLIKEILCYDPDKRPTAAEVERRVSEMSCGQYN